MSVWLMTPFWLNLRNPTASATTGQEGKPGGGLVGMLSYGEWVSQNVHMHKVFPSKKGDERSASVFYDFKLWVALQLFWIGV